ncbi:MAG TPA: tRNA (guanine(46)-N(7))-methyltransferase TrmB [Rhizomicrobium sp.]|nr:tRNA (guanine(46)-N(7))-methyltransferase TrmB [Rhizomicrobium sp.]
MPAPSDEPGDSVADVRRPKLYGRRKGPKLSDHQAVLVETLLPRLKLQIRKDADPEGYFGSAVHDVWLEIGFGAGEHLLWQAEHHSDIGIIGAEPYESGVAKLLAKIDSLGADSRGNLLARVRIHPGDARELIESVPHASLGRVFLLFPDPWPKRRHHKRRIIQSNTLSLLARAMKEGAELRFASDDPSNIAWTLERVIAHGAFAWIAESSKDWLVRPNDWPGTRYEQKALHGIPVFFSFIRKRKEDVPDLQFRASRRK